MSGASSGLHAGGAEAGSPGILGHFTDRLEPIARRELLGVVEDYRRGLIPLIAADPCSPLRPNAKGGVPARPDLSRPASDKADAAKSRLSG
jgi:hypothetical protein